MALIRNPADPAWSRQLRQRQNKDRTCHINGRPLVKHCCPRGAQAGIQFDESGSRTCRRHYSSEQASLIQDLDRRGTAIGLSRDDADQLRWPASANTDVQARTALTTWAESHRLRRSQGQPVLHCVCWPTSHRRSRCECGHNGTQFYLCDATFGHLTHWSTPAGERAVLVYQPYQITDAGRAILDEWNARNDVHIEIRDDAWYGHGTTFIGIWNARFAPEATAGSVAAIAAPQAVAVIEYRDRPDGGRGLETATHTVAMDGTVYTVPAGATVLAPGWKLTGTNMGISGIPR
ncbi:D-lyxose/D-mannose family sugar isomerase [Glycomyces sp. A-F 0318]|uniref:D-lyxose/D-mannose family sugar isomerase n=1 Tax=Glycomyces amatae TaxID=2881355 RepID=UPI001E548E0A|nr:D-lyxose/D-mannose family sugar isomerase [Glycomyces amatae]MCD0445798.1 D-lyxose/D-mannose family sugar isomerase [Glycomyces amatae]